MNPLEIVNFRPSHQMDALMLHDSNGPRGYGADYHLQCLAISKGLLEPSTNIFNIADSGRKENDLIMGVYPGQKFISRRLLEFLIENNVTGYQALPISIVPPGYVSTEYFRLILTGRIEIVKSLNTDPMAELFGPWLIDVASWDHSDMFTTLSYSFPLMTAKLFKKLKKAKFSVYSSPFDVVWHTQEGQKA